MEEAMRTSAIAVSLFVALSSSLCLATERSTNTGCRNLQLPDNAITVTDGRITSNVESAELRAIMVEIARQLPCSLYFDPHITNVVTVRLKSVEIGKALLSLLNSVSYVISWQQDRIADIRIYHAGNREKAVLVWNAEQNDSNSNPELDSLISRGNAALPQLLAILTNTDNTVDMRLAAEALAKLGSPEAVNAIYHALGALQDGDLKEEICRLASCVTNRESADVLMEILTLAQDRSLIRASEYALGHMVDSAMLSAFAKAYDANGDAVIKERVLNLVRNTCSPDAESALIDLAGPLKTPPSEPLARAALEGLSHIGTATATDNLLQRLESVPADRTRDIFNVITQVSGTDESRAQLQYAAMGNKQVSGDQTRVAAIYGLGNYPDGETRIFVQQLLQDSNTVIRAAAQRTLNNMTGE